MKLLFDFLPIILFFGTFKYATAQKDWAAGFATEHFSFLVSGGVVGPNEAPVLLATLVVMAATLLQIAFLLARGKKIDVMLWVNLVIIVVLGAATVWFHNETFIKWKPTALYWAMGISFWISQIFFKKNLIHTLTGGQLELPPAIWHRLTVMWSTFFGLMGVLNLYVAFNYPIETWVNFKVFGSIGLPLVFMLVTGLYLSRHLPREGAESKPPKLPS